MRAHRTRMTRMGTLCALAASGAIVSAMALGATSGVAKSVTSAHAKKCGSLTTITKPPAGSKGKTIKFVYDAITATGVSCKNAKSELKKFGSAGMPAGWKFSNGHTFKGRYPLEAIVTKGKQRITYRYRCGGC
ncbi:MAG: hypothetical protein ACYDA6_00630 [Solirubrobacteraceae bacterium]